MEKVLFIGSGGVAREVTSWAKNLVGIVGYATLDADEHARFGLPGQAFPNDVTPEVAGTDRAVLAIGLPWLRRRLDAQLTNAGFKFVSLVHSSAVVADNAKIGEGTIICPQVTISSDVTLGRLTFVNFCVGIGHDATVGNYVQVNPGVQIGGFSRIGTSVLIGSGATVRDGTEIGDDARIGSGSVVLGRVRSSVTVMGNPAKRMRAFEN
jgi:sugar O-acyltransferase (sialic acid O-acetyltransferase NeuD family)